MIYIFTLLFVSGCSLILLYILRYVKVKEKTGLDEIKAISIEKIASDKIKRDLRLRGDSLSRIEQKYEVIGKEFTPSSFIFESVIYALLLAIFTLYMFSKLDMTILFFAIGLSIHYIRIDAKYRKVQRNITKNMKKFVKVLDANAIGASNAVDVFVRSLKSLSSPYKEQIEEVLLRSKNSSFEYELNKLALRLDNDYLAILASNFSRIKLSGSNIRNPLIALAKMIENDEKNASDVRGKKKGQMWKVYVILGINFSIMFLIRVFTPELFNEILMSSKGISLGSLIAIALAVAFLILHLVGRE